MAFEIASGEPLPFARPCNDPLSIRRAAIIGNYPPRVCGIATFTRDLLAGLKIAAPATRWTVVAMNDAPAQPYDFGGAVDHVIAQDSCDDYVAVADALNRSDVEVVFVQHEFGIFGGPAGSRLLLLLRRLRMPVIVTMHTVLENPDADQRRVTNELVRNAAAVVVMTRKGASLLKRVFGAPAEKVHVVPHGAPFRSLAATSAFKAALGLKSRSVITTFGLLSPNKGIETIIKAMPRILERHPATTYLVVGATHPNLVAREGEAYRESLVALAQELGVQDNVQFIDRFVNDDELVDILQASDVYVTPYLTETQITSGTLSYAIALGRPVVSTPYWHAAEALADGVGILCPFGDAACFGDAIADVLADDKLRQSMALRAWVAGKPSRWGNVGNAYMTLAAEACQPAGTQAALP